MRSPGCRQPPSGAVSDIQLSETAIPTDTLHDDLRVMSRSAREVDTCSLSDIDSCGLVNIGRSVRRTGQRALVEEMQAALPVLDGDVQVAGLSAPVMVRRDAHGVPHIDAATGRRSSRGAGYVTAQDRLWQMDVTRRYINGELAEIFGPCW